MIMNDTNCVNRPKKKLKQASILDFMTTNSKTTNNSQLNEKYINNMNGNKNIDLMANKSINDNSSDLIIASTSTLRVKDSDINYNDFETQLNTSVVECIQIESDSSIDNDLMVLNSNQRLSQTIDESNDAINGLQMSDLSEIPETPELFITDDEFEDEMQSLSELNRIPECSLPLSPLRPDSSRYVLYRLPFIANVIPNPYPNRYEDKWDSRHVKMPNSPNNQIIAVKLVEGLHVSTRVSKWDLIEENLFSDIKSSQQLEESIKTYNPFMRKFNFDVLHLFLNENCDHNERNQFFDEVLPKLIELTLQLPSIVTQSVPLLRQKQNATLFLSQQQIACLLANAFFCTFPKRSQTNEEFRNYPIINFLGLFSNDCDDEYPKTKIEKLKCIINYFRRIIKETPKGIVSFERRCLSSEELPEWHNSNKPLRKLKIIKNGLIEREGFGLLQVDFANKYVGGGVIGSGCVQEEIRFVICPELIISRLFTEKLLDNEVLIISGCEQFNSYSGYANTFCWEQNYFDKTVRDEWGRLCTRIAVIDALYFSYNKRCIQYETNFVDRELNKAFCGFVERRCDPIHKSGIASGNWGCGAFNGDPKLKAIIQLMAASQADRDLVLFTFNDINLKLHLNQFYQFISSNGLTVRHLYKALKLYQQNRKNSFSKQNIDLFKFICDSKDLILDNSK